MDPHEELARLNQAATELARRRGLLTNQQQVARKALAEIAPRMGPHNVIEDPADSDASLRPRRVALGQELTTLEIKIGEIDRERQGIEPALAEGRTAVKIADYTARREAGVERLKKLVAALTGIQSAASAWADCFREVAALYPAHEQLDLGRRIPTYAGLPLLQVQPLLTGAGRLLDRLGEFDPSLLPSAHPSRVRAERIENTTTAHQMMRPRPIVTDADLPQMFVAKHAPPPDPKAVAERELKRLEAQKQG